MTQRLTGNRSDYVVLVRVYTDYPDDYLAIAEMDAAVSIDGRLYEPRLLRLSDIVESLPEAFQTSASWSAVSIELSNPDRRFNESLDDNAYWAWKTVEIFRWLPGTSLSETQDLVFKGFVEARRGVSMDGETIRLRVSDFRSRWKADLPTDILETDDYEYLPDEYVGRPIPILYGDFSTEIADRSFGVEAVCLDTGVRNGEQTADPLLLVARPAADKLQWIDSTVTIVRSMDEVTEAQTTDIVLADGTFRVDRDTWSGVGDYEWQAGDVFVVKARGETTIEGSSERLYDNPAEVLRHIIVTHTGAGSSDVDTASYSSVYNYFKEGSRAVYWKARRHLTDSRDVWDHIADLAFEFGIELGWRYGKITFELWEPYIAHQDDPNYRFDESDVVDDSYGLEVDPSGAYCNELKAQYHWSPDRQRYDRSYSVSNDGITDDTVAKALEFDWQYYRKPVLTRIQRLAWLNARPPIVHTVHLGFRGLSLFPGDRIRLTYAPAGLNGRDMQVRHTRKDLMRGVVEIEAWDAYLRDDIGRWAPAGTPTYINATVDERKRWGFWTDALGRAHYSEDRSVVSKWI